MARMTENDMPTEFVDLDGPPSAAREAARDAAYHPSEGKPGAVHDAVPEDVLAFIDEMGAAREYTCTILRLENGSKAQVDKLRNMIPDNDDIGVKYGPGEYTLVFSWMVPNRKTPMAKRIPVVIGADYIYRHRAYLESVRPTQSAPQGSSLADAMEIIGKAGALFGKGGNDNSGVMELVKLQAETNREQMKDLREQLRADREDNKRNFQDLLRGFQEGLKSVAIQNVAPKTFREQIEEMQAMKTVFAQFSGTGPIEDNRPAWLQAVDAIGDKVSPLLEALASGGFKKAGAEMMVKRGLDTDVGRALMANHGQQVNFIAHLLSQADTPQKQQGVRDLARSLKIPLTETVAAPPQ